jgi:hypothetical protein
VVIIQSLARVLDTAVHPIRSHYDAAGEIYHLAIAPLDAPVPGGSSGGSLALAGPAQRINTQAAGGAARG